MKYSRGTYDTICDTSHISLINLDHFSFSHSIKKLMYANNIKEVRGFYNNKNTSLSHPQSKFQRVKLDVIHKIPSGNCLTINCIINFNNKNRVFKGVAADFALCDDFLGNYMQSISLSHESYKQMLLLLPLLVQ